MYKICNVRKWSKTILDKKFTVQTPIVASINIFSKTENFPVMNKIFFGALFANAPCIVFALPTLLFITLKGKSKM